MYFGLRFLPLVGDRELSGSVACVFVTFFVGGLGFNFGLKLKNAFLIFVAGLKCVSADAGSMLSGLKIVAVVVVVVVVER